MGLNEYEFFPKLFLKLPRTEDNLSTSYWLTSITTTSSGQILFPFCARNTHFDKFIASVGGRRRAQC